MENNSVDNKPFSNEYEAESAIQEIIKKDSDCTCHFNYLVSNSQFNIKKIKLELVTFNTNHKTQFLLHTIEAENKIKAANMMYKHVYQLKNNLTLINSPFSSYTVEWFNKSENKMNKSSFYGHTIEEILQKFYYGKSRNNFIIYNIRLNPIS